MRNIIVVDQLKDWPFKIDKVEVVAAADYLKEDVPGSGRVRVFNFCKSYRYQSLGYYVTLIAEARGDNAIPSLMAVEDIKLTSLTQAVSEDLQELINQSLKKIMSSKFVLSVYFKQNVAKQYERLAKQLADRFQMPMFQVEFVYRNKKWCIQDVSPVSLKDIPEGHLEYVEKFAKSYFVTKRFVSSQRVNQEYDLAILVDDKEPDPPSCKQALANFIEAGKKFDIRCELITKNDYSRLAEFDALFIRATTSVDNFTYRFSRRAFVDGLVVIDDPMSIIRCSNKIFLYEALKIARLPTPNGVVLQKRTYKEKLDQITFPCVLKLPDGSFSKGVAKAENVDQFIKLAEGFFVDSDLVLVQSFVPTEFDWRIGVLDQQPLFAAKYYMAKDHWQVYNWNKVDVQNEWYGNTQAVAIKDVPSVVLDAALRASKLMGNGLYGVDMKQYQDQVYVIEVNDNPNVDAGIEDKLLGKGVYEAIMKKFAERLNQKGSVK
jgi:glutathione synthase/RimK-type ligase-like ATP-grasp enzyme